MIYHFFVTLINLLEEVANCGPHHYCTGILRGFHEGERQPEGHQFEGGHSTEIALTRGTVFGKVDAKHLGAAVLEADYSRIRKEWGVPPDTSSITIDHFHAISSKKKTSA